MNKLEPTQIINLLCVNEYNKDIPINSYYYQLKENWIEIIKENWMEIIKENLENKERIEIIETLMKISINIEYLKKEILIFFIEKVPQINNDEIAKIIIRIIVQLLQYYLNSEIMELIFKLYEKLNRIQSSYLTGYLIESINNEPISYYQLNGMNTGISLVIQLPIFPEYSYAIKTNFFIETMTDDSFPVIFSINATMYKLTCAIEGSNKHLVIKCETTGKRTQQLYSGISFTREYDTQFIIQKNQWYSLNIYHNNNRFIVQLNNQQQVFPINYPLFKETILLYLGYIKGIPGTSLIGKITGFQWMFDVYEFNDINNIDWFDYEIEFNRQIINNVIPRLVLNVGVTKSPLKSEGNILKKIDTLNNKTPFIQIELLDVFSDYLFYPIIEIATCKFSDLFIEDDYLTKCIHLLSLIEPSNITNVIKLLFGLMVKDIKVNEWCLNRHFFTFIFDQLEIVIQKGNDTVINEHIKLVSSILNMTLNNDNIHHALIRLFSLPSKLTLNQQLIFLKEFTNIFTPKIVQSIHIEKVITAKEIVLIFMGNMEITTKILLFQSLIDLIPNILLNNIIEQCFSFIKSDNWIIYHMLWKVLQLEPLKWNVKYLSFIDVFKSKIQSINDLVASYCLMIWIRLGGNGPFEVINYSWKVYQTCLYLSYNKEPQFEFEIPTLNNQCFQEEVNTLTYKPILPLLFESFEPPFTQTQKEVIIKIFKDISSCKPTHNVYYLLSSISSWIDIISKILVEYIDDTEMKYVLTVFYHLMKITNTTIKQIIDILRLLLPDNKQFIQLLLSLLEIFITNGHYDFNIGIILSIISNKINYGISTNLPFINELYKLINNYISNISFKWLTNEWLHLSELKEYYSIYILFIHLFISHINMLILFNNTQKNDFELLFSFINFILPFAPHQISLSFFVWYIYSIYSFFTNAPPSIQSLKEITCLHLSSIQSINQQYYNQLNNMFDNFTFKCISHDIISYHINEHQKELDKIQSIYFEDVVLIPITPKKSKIKLVHKGSILKSLSASLSRSSSISPHSKPLLSNRVNISKQWQDGELSNFKYLQYINEVEHYNYFPKICSTFKQNVFELYYSNKVFPILSECLTKKEVLSLDLRESNFPSEWFFLIDSLKNVEIPKEFAESPRQCVQHLQLLLESPRISKYLNKWISSTFMNFRKEKPRKISYDFNKLINVFEGTKGIIKDPLFIGEIYNGEEEIRVELLNEMIYFIDSTTIKSCLERHIKGGNFIQLYKGRIDDICIIFDDGIIFGKKGMKNIIITGNIKHVIKCNYVQSVHLLSNFIVIGTETEILICNFDGIIIDKIKGCFNIFTANDCVFGIENKRLIRWKERTLQFDIILSQNIKFVTGGNSITYVIFNDSSFSCINEIGEIYLTTSFMDVDIIISMKALTCAMFDFIFLTTNENIFIITNRHVEMRILTAITFTSDSSGHIINDICLPLCSNDSPETWNFLVLNKDNKKHYIHLYRIDYIILSKI
ncbi:hypothetical protein KM1_121930 [Entamoeba histolytica HM-3:IMSS]|uniref:Beige/BEACH domain containing protein n=2 Tax=Entamoeba histolytica TaxID=5759 RepID=M7WQF2_ENTHI|nr:hypothetical protein KM1_121930 [Entamoeba histolytica HM-3:IMSS]